ncbi:MAG TPA: hypothetical protein VM510_14175, partial [Caulifigura sp.]|nr:hypothetical protein [Caulifigura sp.]
MFEPLNHHPGAIAIGVAGIITFLGLVGVGEILCHLAGFRIREPWRAVLASLTGMLAVSLAVQLAAMLGGVPRSGWSVAWGVLAAIGLWQGRKWIPMAGVLSRRVTSGDPFLLVAIAANAITFAVALAPSSKADELYYHMLVPQRLLQDGGLVFYRSPWQSAILPQMPYQLLQVVLHAIGVADAANVMSWCFAILLQVLVSSVASRRGAPAWWG